MYRCEKAIDGTCGDRGCEHYHEHEHVGSCDDPCLFTEELVDVKCCESMDGVTFYTEITEGVVDIPEYAHAYINTGVVYRVTLKPMHASD